jgi:uncharacterized protein (TIGR03435 family)
MLEHMTKYLALAALGVLFESHCHCQASDNSAAKAPAFEVASITPCPPGTPEPPGEHAAMVQFTYPGGRFTARATTVKFLLEWAYDLLPAQHSTGPAWMGAQRYDIVAKAAGNASDEEMKRMARTLLAERFQLKFHRESKQTPVIVLSLGKTPPKLYPPQEGEKHSLQVRPQTGADEKPVSYHVAATRFSLVQLLQTFARQLDRVIVDETGLEGDFDFTLDLTPDDARPNPLDPSLIVAAIEQQLGLTVTSRKQAVDFFSIDGVEKVTAGN